MSEVFSIMIDNRTKAQNDGPHGYWLDLPTTAEKLQEAMREIHISADNPQDFFIAGFSYPEDRRLAIPYDMVLAADVDELNFLAARLDTLDERWTPENIRRSMGRYATFGNRRAYISYPPQMPQELSDWFRPFHKTSHIYKLYLHYCYLLGYLPKHADYKPTSPYLKEDLRKLDELAQQVRYMSKYGIETFDDLYADR